MARNKAEVKLLVMNKLLITGIKFLINLNRRKNNGWTNFYNCCRLVVGWIILKTENPNTYEKVKTHLQTYWKTLERISNNNLKGYLKFIRFVWFMSSNIFSYYWISSRNDNIMNMLPDGYIKRTTSTIPFGYEYDEVTGYLKPIDTELEALLTVENMIINEEVSLQTAVDWLEYETGRKISTPD